MAEDWLTEWTAVGVEGLVIKGLDQTYQPGRRGWLKYRTRNTAEAVIGAVTGSVIRPGTVLLGRYTIDGHFLLVARSTPLGAPASCGARRRPAHPRRRRPPLARRSLHFALGSREPLVFTPVAPQLVAEFHGDTAVDRGRWRHPVNLHRLRIDLTPDDVSLYGAEPPSADPVLRRPT
ncbi:hypothetical protein [Streptomyces sp.]|uniref:hypothetical protein n=1 Tax=Streptomyces sp. TaxID=1931 RepID=UPI002D7721EF|nr:hypothetical protein [Streptomyces sp.]HET6359312.1 hypothetical protein [Streptomyces sp.]